MYAQLSKDIFRPWDAWKKDFGNWNLLAKYLFNISEEKDFVKKCIKVKWQVNCENMQMTTY